MTDAPTFTSWSRKSAVTVETLAAAFTEWDRRYREDPDRFESEAHRLLKTTPETYGDACAPYLLAILDEQAAAEPGNGGGADHDVGDGVGRIEDP